jgi:UDP-glucose 4-epimerase
MEQIVITGANGLLGYETVKQLAAHNQYSVFALQRNVPPEHTLPHIHYIQADLSNTDYLLKLPPQIDIVMHLAQSNHFRQFPEQANDIFSINSQSTLQLLDYARLAGAQKFVYLSTGGIYSSGKTPYREEDGNCFDTQAGFYASSKFIGEKLAENYRAFMDIVIFRPFFIYGPRQKKDMLIARLINQIQTEQEIRLDGAEGIQINPIHVSDAAAALLAAIPFQGSSTFNLGGNEMISLRQLCIKMGSLLQKEPRFQINEHQLPKDLTGNISLLKQALYTPMVSLQEGLNEMIQHEK